MKPFSVELFEEKIRGTRQLTEKELELVCGGGSDSVNLGTVIVKGNKETGETTVSYD